MFFIANLDQSVSTSSLPSLDSPDSPDYWPSSGTCERADNFYITLLNILTFVFKTLFLDWL